MTERNPPVWMQSGTYNAVDDRLVTGLLADRDRGPDGNGDGILGGVVPGFGQLAVAASGTTMQVTVSAGALVIPAPGLSPPGAYVCYNEGPSVFNLGIAATGNPRIDVIYAEVEDLTTGGDESEWRLGVQEGAPSASPTTPVLVPGRFPIAAVRVVPASQNGGVNKVTQAQVTDLRRMLTSIGGTHITKNGLPNPPHAPGRLLYNQDAKYLYISNGATWDYFLTYQGWMNLFASVRPRQAAGSVKATIATGAGPNEFWYAAPPRGDGVAGNITPVSIPNVQSPSGLFRVSISAHGRTQLAGGSAHLSVRVLNGSTTLVDPSTAWRGIGFYMTAWEHHGTTYVVSGLPANTPLTFRLEFYRAGVDANTVSFDNYFLLVEPIL